MNASDAAIIVLYNLFDTEYREIKCDELNWRISNSNKRIDDAVVSMILGDIDGKIEATLQLKKAKVPRFVFEHEVGIKKLITMSGGNKRVLYRFLRDLFGRVGQISDLPVTQRNVNHVISAARDVQRRTVDHENWELLAKVYLDPLISCGELPEYQDLIRSQSVFYYTGHPCYWLINPLIRNLPQFQEALQKLQ